MKEFEWWIVQQKTRLEILDLMQDQVENRPWVAYFLHDRPLSLGNLSSNCRMGHVPFDQCVQDCYFHVDRSKNIEMLAAGGITTQINWDFDPNNLPDGWQGAVRQSYLDSNRKHSKPNTQVALLAFTTQRYRGQGQAGMVLKKMCHMAQYRGYRYCIVPALLPTQFEREYVQMPMKDISHLQREDGQFYDYWLRLHTRMGATVIGFCEHSHRFVFSLDDFSSFVSSGPIDASGDHVVRLDRDRGLGANHKNMWQLVHVNLDQDFVVFNWGCVWVQYDLRELQF